MKLIDKIKARIVAVYNKYHIQKIRQRVVNSNHSVTLLDKMYNDFRTNGFSLAESKLFCLNQENYKDYITTWEAYQPRLINNPFFIISDDKYLFSLVFSHYVKTPECYALIQDGKVVGLKTNLRNSDLYSFILTHGGAVIKDRGGSDGFNVYVLISNNSGQLLYKDSIISPKELEDIIHQCKNSIVQERIRQGAFENEMYSRSINTIRVISMRKKNNIEHEIVAATQRIGTQRSEPVDNFNQGGASSLIDIDTGELGPICSIFYQDKKGNYVAYDVHPDTGIQIRGREIPNWRKIKMKIIELSKKLPFFEYIAWDIALLDDDIVVIEINMKSSLNVFQIHQPMTYSLLGEKYQEHGWLVDHLK